MIEQEWFSDAAVRERYRHWLMAKAESGELAFVPFEQDVTGEWFALPTLAQYVPLEEIKPFADVIYQVDDWKDRSSWTQTPIWRREAI